MERIRTGRRGAVRNGSERSGIVPVGREIRVIFALSSATFEVGMIRQRVHNKKCSSGHDGDVCVCTHFCYMHTFSVTGVQTELTTVRIETEWNDEACLASSQ